jgi:hypothetical protein
MAPAYSMAFLKAPRYGLLTAIFVSFAAHTLLLTLEMRSPPTPSPQSSATGYKILLLSARKAFAPNMGSPVPAQSQEPVKKDADVPVEKDLPKLSTPAESLDTFTPTPAPEDPVSVSPSALTADETGSVLPFLLSEPIFPGGSPNRGKWGQRSGPPPVQRNAQGNRGPAFVVPFLQSMSTRLATGDSCDIKVSNTWTVAQISCTDSGSTSLIAGFLSQQLQMVNSLPDPGYCFQVKQGELSTLSCN